MEEYSDCSKVKVGDRVWWSDVNSRNRGLREGIVTKVGTKLITVENGRVFRKDTGRTNDNYGHQILIVDIELYETVQQANKAMRQLAEGMRYGVRKSGVTYADILEAAKLLKIEIKE